MSGSLEEAYVAVERAYGQADFAGALHLAQALQPQVPPGRPDLLDQRLQLLLGHIHLYGLNQPAQATAAYTAVLEGCSEPSYRELASQGLEISRQTMPVASEPQQPDTPDAVPAALQTTQQTDSTPLQGGADDASNAASLDPSAFAASADQPLPATPWLNQLQDPQQALRQIQQAWGTGPAPQPRPATPAVAADLAAAAPWQAAGRLTAPEQQPATAPGEAVAKAEAEQAADDHSTAQSNAGSQESAGLAVLATEASDAPSADPQVIIPVVVTVEDDLSTPGTEAATGAASEEAQTEPDVPAPPTFSEEEWADLKRGLLLVELTTSNAGPTR